MAEDKKDRQELEYQGIKYQRHTSDRGKDLRGTVWLMGPEVEDSVRRIPGFPHIGRVYCLRSGVEHVFGDGPFFAEEKIDGYNTRLFCHDGNLLALTRGGFICPFTTEWAAIWAGRSGLHDFFRENPQHVLCGEVVGDNPYNAQRDAAFPPGAHFLVFDISTGDGIPLVPEKRYPLIEQYQLPSVPLLGQYSLDRIDQLRTVLLDLHNREREGTVLKSKDGKKVIKFVTPAKDLEDIRDGLIIDFDLHHRFFRNRLLRLNLFIQEFNLDTDVQMHKLGKAFIKGYEPLKSFRDAQEEFVIYVRSHDTWTSLQNLITGQVTVITDGIQSVNLDGMQMLKVHFRRVYRKSTHRYKTILKGFPLVD